MGNAEKVTEKAQGLESICKDTFKCVNCNELKQGMCYLFTEISEFPGIICCDCLGVVNEYSKI